MAEAVLDSVLAGGVMFWLLVTGTGRCGTGYLSQVLTSCGETCTHEGLFQPREWGETRQEVKARLRWPEWGWRAESSWLAFPFLHEPELSSLTVVHLVRHPKSVIDSKCRMRFWNGKQYRQYANWARSYLPLLDQYQTIQDKAAYWYIEVNRRIAERADFFHRVEDDVRPLLDRLDIPYSEDELYQNTRYNSRAGYVPSDVQLVNFSTSLRLELMQLSKQYGYRWKGER